MDSGAVLLNVSKLENDAPPKCFDNMALDVPNGVIDDVIPTVDFKTEVNGNGRHNGFRNFESIDLTWRNLIYKVKKGKARKCLVDNMSGEARSGTLTAIMGPSGAGKTTLLNLLTGFYDKGYKGEVQINGYVREQALFNKQSCYVMQEDRLLPALTVYEAIFMSVELRMPNMAPKDKAKKVERSIEEWGLEVCPQHTDRKPLRRPTEAAGHRSRVGQQPACSLPRRTHQWPGQRVKSDVRTDTEAAVFHGTHCHLFYTRTECQDLFLLRHALHGFCGSLHLQRQVSEVASGDYGDYGDYRDALAREFELPVPDSSEATKGTKTNKRPTPIGCTLFKVNQFHQFQILLKRCWLSVFRNKVATPLRIVAYVGFALMLVILYYDIGNKASTVTHNATMFFSMCCICVFQTILPAVIVFPVNISVLMREQRNCWYSLKVFYLANYVTEIPFLVIPNALLVAIVYYPTAQPRELWRVAGVMLFCVQICAVSQAMGLIVSAVSKLQTAVFLALPIVSPAFFFCGFFVPAHLLTHYARWLTDISYIYYGYNGLLLSVYGYGRATLECDQFICLYEDPQQFLEFVGAADKKFYVLVLALLAYEAICRTVAFVLLKIRLARKE
ncbi:hypothetical protein MRX96_025307 [Rhipicephalus microplus]